MNKFEEAKKYIEENIEYIDNEVFDDFYFNLSNEFDYATGPWDDRRDIIGAVTVYFYKAGINPLDYMTSIPKYFLYNVDPDSIPPITIPKQIKKVRELAFYDLGYYKCYYEGTKEEFFHISQDEDCWKGTIITIQCTNENIIIDGRE